MFSPAAPQVNQSVLFDATASTAAQGHALSYAWNFGDNGTGTGVTPNHTYTSAGTFSVVLKVTDTTTGQTATSTKTVAVSSTGSTPPPTASFVFSPQSPATAQSVSFNAHAVYAAAGHSIVSYAWNFGDGGTATGVTTTHPFANAGTFSVVLVVTDDLRQTGTTTRSVTVTSTSPPPPPTASFVFSPTAPVTNQIVSFNATQSSAAAGHTITSYAWNFGDGSTGTGVTPTHPYATAGSFSVVLVVTDDLGKTGTTTNTVTVSLGPPTASFVFSPTSPGTNQDVFFNASASTAAPGRSIAGYAWAFGDGTSPGTGVTPTHAYTRCRHVYRLARRDRQRRPAGHDVPDGDRLDHLESNRRGVHVLAQRSVDWANRELRRYAVDSIDGGHDHAAGCGTSATAAPEAARSRPCLPVAEHVRGAPDSHRLGGEDSDRDSYGQHEIDWTDVTRARHRA